MRLPLTRVLSLALLAALAGSALAAEEAGGEPGKHGHPGKGAKLKEFDANHDGKLDDAEKAVMRASIAEQLKKTHPDAFAKADVDGDGNLSEEEFKAAREKMRQFRDDQRKKADTNGDGTVDESERTAHRAEMAAKLKQNHPDLFAKVDTNGDGSLSEEEFKAGREVLKEARRHEGRGEGEGRGDRKGKRDGDEQGEGKGGEGRKHHGKKKED